MLIVLSLSLMAILVFANVILRYIFDSGITWAEELSRYLFIWMIFLGAITVLQNKAHLSVDLITNAVSPGIRRILLIISNFLVLFTLMIILDGSWTMTLQNTHVNSPATGISMSYIYGIGVVMSLGMAIITINNIIKLFKKKYRYD